MFCFSQLGYIILFYFMSSGVRTGVFPSSVPFSSVGVQGSGRFFAQFLGRHFGLVCGWFLLRFRPGLWPVSVLHWLILAVISARIPLFFVVIYRVIDSSGQDFLSRLVALLRADL